MATALPGDTDAFVPGSADSGAARCRRRLPLLIILAALGVALGSGGAGASVQRAADVRTTVTIGGPPVTVTLGSGAKAYVTFSGSSGQNLGLGVTGSSIACCGATVKLLNPGGTQIGSVGFGTSPVDWNLPRLTATGTHTLLVDPGTKTGSMTLTLSQDIVGGSIAVNGASVTATIARAGQNERFTFSGTPGQYVGLGLTGSSLACCPNQVKLLNPSGTQIGSLNSFGTSAADWNLPVLPTTGTYTLLVDPATNAGSVTLTLSQDIVGGSIAVGGASVTATIARVGQNERFAFSGTSGQNLGLGLTGSSLACCSNQIKLFNPSGTQIGSLNSFGTSAADWNLPVLPTTGTYTLLVDPATKTGSVTLTLSQDIVGGSIAADGASATATIARAGQNGRFIFSAASGQYLGLGLTGSSLACCSNQVKLLNPSGTLIGSLSSFGTSAADWNLPVLTTTGTYTLLVDPGTNTGSVTLTLSNDLVQPLGIGGSPATLTLRVGQNVRFTFVGSSGKTLSFSLSNNSIPSFQVRLLNSVGTQVGGTGFLGSGSVTWKVPTLPTSGNYTIFFEPYASAGSATFALTLAGAPVNISNPAVSGILEDGEIVTASPGAWANAPTSFAYQWQRCIDGTCSDIADAGQNTYTLVDEDINSTVRVSVTASNLSGSTVASSDQTGHVRIPHYSHSNSSCSDIEDPVNFLVDYPRVLRKHFVPGGALETEDYTAGRTGGQAAVTIADGHWHTEIGGSNDSWYDFGANGGCVNQNVFATSSPLLGEGHHVRFWIGAQGRRPVGAAHHDFPCGQTGAHSSDKWIESAQDLANYFYNFEDLNGYHPLPVWAVYHDRPFTVTDKCNVEVPDDGNTQELDFRTSNVLTIFDNWYFG